MAGSAGDECNLTSSSCWLPEDTVGKLDAVAGVRLILSCLSVLGTLSIIVSAILKKQVFSPKVFPIFMISIADFLLAVLWVGGSLVWLRGTFAHRGWCFAASLPTVILECVTINLTLIYAILAHAHVKKRVNATRVRTYSHLSLDHGTSTTNKPAMGIGHNIKTIIAYFTGWVLPLVLVVLSFGILEGQNSILSRTRKCSCWCVPGLGNVVPYVFQTPNHATAGFKHQIHGLLLSYGLVVGLHYLIVFPLLVIAYIRILKIIQRLKAQVNIQRCEGEVLERQSQARRRIVSFLTVFLFTGLANLGASWFLVIKMSVLLRKKDAPSYLWNTMTFSVYYFQSFCTALQGFLNAVVYGGTGRTFVSVQYSEKTSLPVTDSLKSAETEGSVELAKQRSELDEGSEKWDHSMFRTVEVESSVSDTEQVRHRQI